MIDLTFFDHFFVNDTNQIMSSSMDEIRQRILRMNWQKIKSIKLASGQFTLSFHLHSLIMMISCYFQQGFFRMAIQNSGVKSLLLFIFSSFFSKAPSPSKKQQKTLFVFSRETLF